MDRLERILANFSLYEHEHRCMYMQDPDMGQQTTDFDVRSREMRHMDKLVHLNGSEQPVRDTYGRTSANASPP